MSSSSSSVNKVVSSSSSSPAASSDSNSRTGLQDYIGLSEVSSTSCVRMEKPAEHNLNLKETELRLGLPGALSPLRDAGSQKTPTTSDESSELCLLSPRRNEKIIVEQKLFPEENFRPVKDGAVEDKNVYWHTPPVQIHHSYQSPAASKGVVSRPKRGFSEAMEARKMFSDGFSGGKWAFPTVNPVVTQGVAVGGSDGEVSKTNQHGKFSQQASPKAGMSPWQAGGVDHSGNSIPALYMSSRPTSGPNLSGKCILNDAGSSTVKDAAQSKIAPERPRLPSESQHGSNQSHISAADEAPASKAQVVGWPPIRSFRKNTLASNPKPTEESEGKPGSNALYIKVSMEGAPYLRKIDLKMYSRYQELSSALEKMFSCFTIGESLLSILAYILKSVFIFLQV
eukprot:Gb_16092 [translate_table: standard]